MTCCHHVAGGMHINVPASHRDSAPTATARRRFTMSYRPHQIPHNIPIYIVLGMTNMTARAHAHSTRAYALDPRVQPHTHASS